MEGNQMLQEILVIVKALQTDVKALQTDVKALQTDVKTHGEAIQSLREEVKSLRELADFTLETLNFVKDNAVAKDEFNREMRAIRSVMVTKEYLDRKLTELRGDLIVTIRKEDTKLMATVSTLHRRKCLTADDVETISKMEPFRRLTA